MVSPTSLSTISRGFRAYWLSHAIRASPTRARQLRNARSRPPYRYERVRLRRVATDALVAVGAARYSVPVEYVGLTVSVQESAEHYEFFHQDKLVARHPKVARHSVVMDPTHYAGLWQPRSWWQPILAYHDRAIELRPRLSACGSIPKHP